MLEKPMASCFHMLKRHSPLLKLCGQQNYPTCSTQACAADTQFGSISYSGEPQPYIRKGPKCEWLAESHVV